MGKLARLVDGIKEKLLAGAAGGKKKKANNKPAAMCYDKVDKTDSMRAEIRSRRARHLIAKNLAAADSIAGSSSGSPWGCGSGGGKKKKRFLGAF